MTDDAERGLLSSPGLTEIGDGVLGYEVDDGASLYIPVIEAVQPGSGCVSRWLDQLHPTRTVKIPDVLSDRLVGMLRRRGFTLEMEFSPEFEEDIHVWVRKPLE